MRLHEARPELFPRSIADVRDPLTGLRRGASLHLDAALEEFFAPIPGDSLLVVAVDFRLIGVLNASGFGTIVDELLRGFPEDIRQSAESNGLSVSAAPTARPGGDEFVIGLPNTPQGLACLSAIKRAAEERRQQILVPQLKAASLEASPISTAIAVRQQLERAVTTYADLCTTRGIPFTVVGYLRHVALGDAPHTDEASQALAIRTSARVNSLFRDLGLTDYVLDLANAGGQTRPDAVRKEIGQALVSAFHALQQLTAPRSPSPTAAEPGSAVMTAVPLARHELSWATIQQALAIGHRAIFRSKQAGVEPPQVVPFDSSTYFRSALSTERLALQNIEEELCRHWKNLPNRAHPDHGTRLLSILNAARCDPAVPALWRGELLRQESCGTVFLIDRPTRLSFLESDIFGYGTGNHFRGEAQQDALMRIHAEWARHAVGDRHAHLVRQGGGKILTAVEGRLEQAALTTFERAMNAQLNVRLLDALVHNDIHRTETRQRIIVEFINRMFTALIEQQPALQPGQDRLQQLLSGDPWRLPPFRLGTIGIRTFENIYIDPQERFDSLVQRLSAVRS